MSKLVIGIIIVVVLLIIVMFVVASAQSAPSAGAGQSASSPQTPATTASSAGGWKKFDAMNFVWGLVLPKGNSGDGNVKYLGNFGSADECSKACGAAPACNAYTWHDGSGAQYSNQCFGMSHVPVRIAEAGHFSGEKSEGFNAADWRKMKDKVGTFSNTLQRRMGMGSAGAAPERFRTDTCVGTFDCMRENFMSQDDVAAHTMFSGYQRRAVLPG